MTYKNNDPFGFNKAINYKALDNPKVLNEVANMFGGVVEMLPERRGNRMAADINTEKTEALGWRVNKKLKDYIESPD